MRGGRGGRRVGGGGGEAGTARKNQWRGSKARQVQEQKAKRGKAGAVMHMQSLQEPTAQQR